MRTFTKTLVAAALGVIGSCGAASAAIPFGSTSSSYGIAAGGCYLPNNSYGSYSDTYSGCFDSTYRPTSKYDGSAYRPLPSRSVYDAHDGYHAQNGYRTQPYPTSHWNDNAWNDNAWNDNAWNDNAWNDRRGDNHDRADAWSHHPSNVDHYNDRLDNQRYENRYDGSPRFEPWRPMNVSNTRLNW